MSDRSDRNEKGQFKEGGSGGPGRPAKAREEAILKIGREVVTLDRWREIFEQAYKDAIGGEDSKGRDKARRFLAEYLVGKPAQTLKIRNEDADDYDEFADLTDDELRRIAYGDAAPDGAPIWGPTRAAPGSGDGQEGAG